VPSPAESRSPPGVSATYWRLLVDEDLAAAGVLDVGTGAGRIALALAPRCRFVVGVDRSADAVEDARRRASAASLSNSAFVVADADSCEFGELLQRTMFTGPLSVVTAHLFLSDQLVERAARALRSGGALVILGFHADQWKETGRASRFAYDEDRMRALLDRCGFSVEALVVERDVRTFGSADEALAATAELRERWAGDGRWDRWVGYVRGGGRTLTHASLIARGRRR
jgi:ubiquinone/menaquinone biosynthesis C-methylase UbiE